MSALSLQLIGLYFFSVQIIRKLYRNRKLLIGRSLIVNIFSVRIPYQLTISLLKRLFSFNVFDILQGTLIGQISGNASGIFQPVGYRNRIRIPQCIRIYIHCLIFIYYFLICRKNRNCTHHHRHSHCERSCKFPFDFTVSIHDFYALSALFLPRNPMEVLHITLSNIINMAGSTRMTTIILIMAPRASSVQMEPIIST